MADASFRLIAILKHEISTRVWVIRHIFRSDWASEYFDQETNRGKTDRKSPGGIKSNLDNEKSAPSAPAFQIAVSECLCCPSRRHHLRETGDKCVCSIPATSEKTDFKQPSHVSRGAQA